MKASAWGWRNSFQDGGVTTCVAGGSSLLLLLPPYRQLGFLVPGALKPKSEGVGRSYLTVRPDTEATMLAPFLLQTLCPALALESSGKVHGMEISRQLGLAHISFVLSWDPGGQGWMAVCGSLTWSILPVLLSADRMWFTCSPAGLTLGKDSIPEGA